MASANSNDKLIIFKGDDTGGVFGRRLTFTIEAGEGVDLSGCRAEWIFDGIVKTFPAPLVNGETREVFYSHNETRCMALGVRYGTFRIIDAAGKVRTLTNTKPVEVTNDAARCYPGASAASFVVHGIGDMKHSEFADLDEKEGMTLNEVGIMVNTLIRKLKGTIAAFASLLAFGAFADGAITPQTDFGDISPTAKISTVISDAGAVMIETDPTVPAWAKQANPPQTMTTNAVDRIANAAVETNALTVATTNRVALLESSKADKSALETHVANTDNPHAVTAAQVGAVPLVEDASGEKTAVTIGRRKDGERVGEYSFANGSGVTASFHHSHAEGGGTTACGAYSHAEGVTTTASGYNSHAEGNGTTASGMNSHAEGESTTASGMNSHAEGGLTTASGDCSHAEGNGTTASGINSHAEGAGTTAAGAGSHAEGIVSETREEDKYAFAWNGDYERPSPYISHGPGTFNINPAGGLNGFWIGEQTLFSILTNKANKADISAENPTFSNAVLAVGLNIDTNSVAVLNEIASTFGGFPLGAGETATTVGGLLAALAAAVAWLKKNKVGSFASVGGASATVENGVAKLSGFFTESNSLLNGRLSYSRNATGLKDRAFNTISFDGTEFNLSTALEAVTPTASGQPRDLLIVATATAATTISFTAGTIKGDKPTIDGSGTWLITLTEYAANTWYCRQIKMEDAA